MAMVPALKHSAQWVFTLCTIKGSGLGSCHSRQMATGSVGRIGYFLKGSSGSRVRPMYAYSRTLYIPHSQVKFQSLKLKRALMTKLRTALHHRDVHKTSSHKTETIETETVNPQDREETETFHFFELSRPRRDRHVPKTSRYRNYIPATLGDRATYKKVTVSLFDCNGSRDSEDSVRLHQWHRPVATYHWKRESSARLENMRQRRRRLMMTLIHFNGGQVTQTLRSFPLFYDIARILLAIQASSAELVRHWMRDI